MLNNQGLEQEDDNIFEFIQSILQKLNKKQGISSSSTLKKHLLK